MDDGSTAGAANDSAAAVDDRSTAGVEDGATAGGSDRSTAGAGVVLAGLALVAAGLPWDAAGVGPVENATLAVLAGVALLGFSLRRHGVLARESGALVAGIASLGVVGYVGLAASGVASASALGGDGAAATSPWGVGLALVGGVGGAVAAYGDWRGLPASFGEQVRATSWGLAVGFLGLFAIAAWGSLLVSGVAGVTGTEPGAMVQLALSSVALGLGTGTIALIYFRWADRTVSYLDVSTPDRRDAGYAVGGVAALLGLQVAVSEVFSQLGLSTAEHSVQQQAASGNVEILLLLIPLAFLVIGPGEELLYRNIIQKDLYGTFGEWGAVAVGSGVFALAHIPAYAGGGSLASVLNTLVVIFFLSVILGAAYLKTENLVAPVLIHGAYDAIVFGQMYVQLTGGA
ncbi:CPBP family intramembrane glutamic endopeptidase [Halorussus litoreus]|uniref:CPBP family intramembrane glutamic endopeptidase n=1 Tax=Halorussus litoreus TaxID=1710536 RepID=UPI000E2481F2|nr:type II CAAX endopeptidase family protein [Halorussus litoreus]